MFAFYLCLVFNAHPDAWLPESEFVRKYVSDYAQAVLAKAKSLDSVITELRMEKNDEVKAALTRLRDDHAEQLQEFVTRFNMRRAEARLTALVDPRRFIAKYCARPD
jgi:hypothetical protein